MTTKLIISKFITDVEVQTMTITLQGENNDLKIFHSDWSESRPHAKNNVVKTSRLIVKMVNGEASDNLDLDNCAEIINTSQFIKEDVSCHPLQQPINTQTIENTDNELNYLDHIEFDYNIKNNQNMHNVSDKNCRETKEKSKYQDKIFEMTPENSTITTSCDSTYSDLSPLEYSLQKIKENNAKIMENIHKLNRTLNYTKDNENNMGLFYPKTTRAFPCTSCGKCFVYETGLKRHFSIRHCLRETTPRWQVVWTCIQCFQVWPKQDLAFKHSTLCCKMDSIECIREIKTSSLLQCEFCEKVFTSIPCLLKHSKLHTTANNYECNPCKIVFLSYKASEDHWLTCPFLKICYNFSLPRMLLCNICDRKFKNYDQLYNHR